MSCCYWAKFKKINGDTFRFDTRIYLDEIICPSDDDICIGGVVGKNPGSAEPKDFNNCDLQEINLDGDQLLPNVRKIIEKAYKYADKPIKAISYVQVLNLMYITDKDLASAIRKNKNHDVTIICEKEKLHFPFLWYLWGNDDNKLNSFKKRYSDIKSDKHFYFHTQNKRIVESAPSLENSARHTQGLKHELVVPYISNLL